MLTTTRLVTRPRGSWKYQNAYGVVIYTPRLTRKGYYVWHHCHDRIRKMSMPQIKKHLETIPPTGSAHNERIPDETLAYSPEMPPILA